MKVSNLRWNLRILIACWVLVVTADCNATESTFANFESPQSHSIAISGDGKRLFAVNTPGNTLAVLKLDDETSLIEPVEIPVGLEPVSVAIRDANEVWVVNHLSDSISVIDLHRQVVVETIAVGDRPGDIVFAGETVKAFVTSMTEASITVIDPRTREVIESIPIPAHSPRTLLASADGTSVWVASYLSGNRTTVIPHSIAPPPPAPTNDKLPPAPAQGIIVATDDAKWKDSIGFDLADEDVFEIDAQQLEIVRRFSGVGTTLFNLAQHPSGDELWVANTNALNLVRFEPQLNGHVVDNCISRISLSSQTVGDVTPVDLNPLIDYQSLPNKSALATALAQPTDIVFAPSGDRAYVAAFGTDRIGVLDISGNVISRIEIGDTVGAESNPQEKRGVRSLAIHPDGHTLYTMNRLSNSVSVVDIKTEAVLTEIPLRDPTPDATRAGRGYLFDAKLSGNGTVSCASCHIDADRDGLAWDLGDPGGQMFSNGTATSLHPMKGPLLTQTLRGLAGEKLFHWRGDRPGLESFNGTFETLMGGERLDDDDLALFVDYLKSIRFGPNPMRALDDSPTNRMTEKSVQTGETIFTARQAIGREGINSFRCVDCHLRTSGAGTVGFTGLLGQPTKAAQLRGLNERTVFAHDGARISGFGFGADGSKSSLANFLAVSHRFSEITKQDKTALANFLFAFPTETPTVVGFNRTIDSGNRRDPSLIAHLEHVGKQAQLRRCEITVTGRLAGEFVRFAYDTDRMLFVQDTQPSRAVSMKQLLNNISKDDDCLTVLATPVDLNSTH